MKIRSSDVERLIPLIYGTIDGSEGAVELVSAAKSAFRAANAGFCIVDPAWDYLSYTTSSVDDENLQHYVDQLHKDPWFIRFDDVYSGPAAVRGSCLIPQNEYRKCRTYARFTGPLDLEYLLACGLIIAEGSSVFLSINRSKQMGDYAADDENLITGLLPHVVRAARISCELRDANRYSVVGNPHFIRIGQDGAVEASPETLDLLSDCSGLRLEPFRLRFSDPGLQERFDATVGSLLNGNFDTDCGYAFPIDVAAGTGSLRLILLPVSTMSTALKRSFSVTVLVLARGGELESSLRKQGLSVAEARAVAAIAGGMRPLEYAESIARSEWTVRTQLKAAMKKLGVHSQVQLLRKVLAGVGG